MDVNNTQPLTTHLTELRNRLMRCIAAVLMIFLMLAYFTNDIYQLVSALLIKHMPVGATMIATDVASPFFTPVRLTFMVALILAVPVLLHQIWAFVAPALYKNERRLVVPLLISSTLLFYTGMAFAYFVVFPLVFTFLTHTAPAGVQVSTDICSYLDFVMGCLWPLVFPLGCRWPLYFYAGRGSPHQMICAKNGHMCWPGRLLSACY